MEINCPEAYPDLKASRKQYNISYSLFGAGAVCVVAAIPIFLFTAGDNNNPKTAYIAGGVVGGVGVVSILAGIPFFLKGNKLFDQSMVIYNRECRQKLSLNFNMDLNTMGLSLKF